MEHAIDGMGMGAAAFAAAAAFWLLFSVAGNYSRLLDHMNERMQQDPVVMETAYE